MTGLIKRGVVTLLVLAWAGSAVAQDPDTAVSPEARALFARATEHYEAERYAQSLADFERVHAMLVEAEHPNAALVLFNMARCYQRLGRARESVEAFERFLAEAPPGAPNMEIARVELQELRARVALDAPEERAPEGVERSPEAPSAETISPVGPIVLGVGGAMLVAAAITGGVLVAEDGALSAMCPNGVCPTSARATAEGLESLAIVTDVLWIGGAALAAAGLVLTLVLRDEAPREPPVTASCSATGCAVRVGGTF